MFRRTGSATTRCSCDYHGGCNRRSMRPRVSRCWSTAAVRFRSSISSSERGLMKTIVVTGGAGFIGSNFARLLLRRGAERVVVLDALTYAGSLETVGDMKSDDRFVFVKGDIADRRVVDDVFRAHRPPWVVNFAVESRVDRSI